MYYEETPTWIPFLKAFGEIEIVKTPTKLQDKLQNRRMQGIYLHPAEDHKGDTYTFWNPITKHDIESLSAIFLQQTYADFHKLNKSIIPNQFAAITDELNEMFNSDEDVIPVDDDGNNLPNQRLNLDDDYNEDEEFVSITEDMLDPTNQELIYTADDYETLPTSVQTHLREYLDQLGPWQLFPTQINKMNGRIKWEKQ
jgi:hypothetical protein